MKNLIAKLQLDANCALGAIWMHIDSQAKRISELESQLAARPADTDKLREAIFKLPLPSGQTEDGVFRDLSSWECEVFVRGALNMRKAIVDLVASTAGKAPVREVPEGMPITQEPKYGIRNNRLFNRASGEFIPEDEPVFIFRARDWHATHVLAYYRQGGLQQAHSEAVSLRLKDFMAFRDAYPERMKEPDTALPAAPVQTEQKP